jgi:hypothetical protein
VNVFELLYVVIAAALSYFLGKYFAAHIGWLGWILGVVCGAGGWVGITFLFFKRFVKPRH